MGKVFGGGSSDSGDFGDAGNMNGDVTQMSTGDGGGGSGMSDFRNRMKKAAPFVASGFRSLDQPQQGHPTQIDVTPTPQLPAEFFQSPNLNPYPLQIDPLTGEPINRKPSSMFYGGR